MPRYFIRRILSIIPTLFIVITLSFFLIRLAPGGPFAREREVPEAILQNLMKRYHMDEPLVKQYLRYMGDVIRWDFGPSYRYRDLSVNEIIDEGLPISMSLGVISLVLATVGGIAIGIISALKQNRWQDYVVTSIAVIGISVPLFVMGPVLQLVFGMKLKILPIGQWISTHGIKAVILPAITLSFPYFAYIARLSRASILEVLRSDYIRTARAKGLKESVVVWKHVLKGAMLPVVTYLGPAFSGIVVGSIVVESVFLVPGIGRPFVQSALNRDYTLIMAEVVVYSIILIIANLVVDILYGFLDPRISYK
ncbi:MAG TPA: ABC transporter permease [Rectinema sp.]|jgi:oligopeptide transport system permease protein|nr:ABC transporter permease [Spirochaetia bacterium]MDI9426441.1 ABC transporter permease [Spirochaetota bacterium]NLH89855.1 ABC transporter permease [Treponema sp.]OQC74580.1 MAG: Oligopeptide transport system permease protein OppB [Spirochaetes bacterium ADurb.Bin001]HNV35538.1 ABC transporter permease [Rectinema sp.]